MAKLELIVSSFCSIPLVLHIPELGNVSIKD